MSDAAAEARIRALVSDLQASIAEAAEVFTKPTRKLMASAYRAMAACHETDGSHAQLEACLNTSNTKVQRAQQVMQRSQQEVGQLFQQRSQTCSSKQGDAMLACVKDAAEYTKGEAPAIFARAVAELER